jgi:transcriptional regulator with XRE-family HTH domain
LTLTNKPGAKSNDPTPQRLRAIRKAQGFETANSFAEFLGVSGQRYGNIESGEYELSKEIAFIIVDRVPGISATLYQRLKVAAVQVAKEHRRRLVIARRNR